jgi:hypothetical protein
VKKYTVDLPLFILFIMTLITFTSFAVLLGLLGQGIRFNPTIENMDLSRLEKIENTKSWTLEKYNIFGATPWYEINIRFNNNMSYNSDKIYKEEDFNREIEKIICLSSPKKE